MNGTDQADLAAAIEHLEAIKATWQAQRSDLDAKLQRVTDAIEALLGDSPGKASASKDQILLAARQVLGENAPQGIPLEDLSSLVKDQLKGQGFKLTGAFRHFERYLQEADDIETNDAGEFKLTINVAQVA